MPDAPTTDAAVPHHTQRVLRRDNVVAALVHLVQAVAVLVLASDFALPVTASYLEGPPGTRPQDPVTLFDIRTGVAVAAFLALSAVALSLVASVNPISWTGARSGRGAARGRRPADLGQPVSGRPGARPDVMQDITKPEGTRWAASKRPDTAGLEEYAGSQLDTVPEGSPTPTTPSSPT